MHHLRFLICLLFTLAIHSISLATPVKLTNTITWEINDDGTLFINGSGEMPDFKYDKPKHWLSSKFQGKIKKVVISEGITRIGDYNFMNSCLYKGNGMANLTEVKLPSTLKIIGIQAFCLTNVVNVNFPEGLTEIWHNAFEGCKMTQLSLPCTLERIYNKAFYNCKYLTDVNFNNARVMLSPEVFSGDKNLCKVLNAENIQYDKTYKLAADFSNVFRDTQLLSLSESTPADTSLNSPETDSGCEQANEEEYDDEFSTLLLPGYIVGDKLNVRSEPDPNAEIVFQLPKYEIVSASCFENGTLYEDNGWVFINYIDYEGAHEGYIDSKYLRMFDMLSPDKSLIYNCDRSLVTDDDDPTFGDIFIEGNENKFQGTMEIKNQDMIDDGGNGILVYVKFNGTFYYGNIPIFQTLGPVDEEMYGDMLRNGVYYDSKNDILSIAGFLWK